MQTFTRNTIKLIVLLWMALGLLGSGLSRAQAAALPASSACTGSGTVTCNLWAKTGSFTPAGGAATTIWGYTDSSGGTLSTPGGPVLIVTQGDVVTVTLHNTLTEASGLLFQGQSLVPDQAGAPAGTDKDYTFTATQAGTFLYEAALLPNAQHQVAMGLYGALVVRPATAGQAYADPATAFDEEALVVLSELDPALNNSATPAGFDMRNYAPQFFLINGNAYPGTDVIPVTLAGNRVLLRYVNAGLQAHAMSTLGLTQKIVGQDGAAYANGHSVVAETIATGQTLDAIVTIPAASTPGTKYAVYDANMLLHNSNTGGLGGMLTFLQFGTSGSTGGDTSGPLTSGVTLTPGSTNGSVSVALSASINDTTTGNSNVTAAEYFIDTVGAAGTGTALTGTFGSPVAAVSGSISVATQATLSSGNHTLYVRGQDSAGNWGPVASAVLNLDKTGPTTSAPVLSPNPSNGSADVNLTASASDSTSGNNIISAAEYTLDGGAATAMTVNAAAPVAGLSATLPAATVNALTEGSHTVAVRSQDALGNWGAPVSVSLNLDKTGAGTSAVSAAPNPNNGATPFNTSTPAVRVSASFTDGGSTVAAAEGFLDAVAATGTGFTFLATDGVFNSSAETGYADIPLASIGTLSSGPHTIYVHARDAAGNWGATATTILVIDKQAPTVSGLALTPAATNNAAVVVSASASDAASGNSNIGGGEYFIDTVGTAGTGAAMTAVSAAPVSNITATIPAATVGGLTAGNHTLYVRAKDAAGNWSTAISATLLIDRSAPTFSGITLSPSSIPVGTASTGLTVNGASDPLVSGLASGVAGGEYWFGSTNIPAGTGTAFSGLTTTLNTSALTAGSYTVRVRIRDVAGNWSVTPNSGVRTATLTVTAVVPDAIFADGFETSPFPTNWTSRSTITTSRLNRTAAAALVGSFGMQAQGNNTNYVQFDFGTAANPASATFDARFYFNPNSNTGTNQDIFVARTTGGTTVFRVRYRWNGGTPQVQIQIGTGTANTTWTNITNAASNRIEVVWQAGSTLQLFVGGSLAANQSLTATASSVGQFRVGSVTNGGSAILEYFDAVSAKRSVTPYGP